MTRARGAAFWLAILAVLVVVTVLVGGSGRVDGPPLDPRSTSALGTRALVLLLEDLGATVDVSGAVPRSADAVVLVLRDTLTAEQRGELERFAERGGRVVVMDPTSDLSARVTGASSLFGPLDEATLQPETCDVDALQRIGALNPGNALLLQVGVRAESCFGDGEQAFVVVRRSGRGAVVSIGGAAVVTNERLGDADNAVLAAALLAPERGTRVVIAQPVLTAESDTGFLDLATRQVGPGLPFALTQLIVAFGVYVAVRARRLGRPVSEPQPVQIAGSELVLAVGRLLAQAGSPHAGASLLRASLRAELAAQRGVPAGNGIDALVDAVAPLTSRPRDDVYRALADVPVHSDSELLELMALVDGIRQEVLHRGPIPTSR